MRMPLRFLAPLAAGSLLLLAGGSARALPNPPTHKVDKKADAHARKLYKKGDRAYAEGRYEDAVAAFERAYRLSGRSLLLFNLGNAYERLGRYGEAAEALDRYLPDAKPSEQDIVEKRIDNLRRRAKAEQQDKPPPPPPPPPVRKKARQAAQPSGHPKSESSSPTLGYALLGVGGGALVIGGVFGGLALGARSTEKPNCANAAGGRFCTADAESSITRDKRYSLIADVGFGVGVVAAGVGAYLVLTSHRGKEQARGDTHSRVTSALGAKPRRGGGELEFVGRF